MCLADSPVRICQLNQTKTLPRPGKDEDRFRWWSWPSSRVLRDCRVALSFNFSLSHTG